MSDRQTHYHVLLGNREYLVKGSDDVDATLRAEEWDAEFFKTLVHKFLNSDDPDSSLLLETAPLRMPLAWAASSSEEKFRQAVDFSDKPAVTLVAESYGTGEPIEDVLPIEEKSVVEAVPLFYGRHVETSLRDDDGKYVIDQHDFTVRTHEIINLVAWPEAHSAAVGLVALAGARM